MSKKVVDRLKFRIWDVERERYWHDGCYLSQNGEIVTTACDDGCCLELDGNEVIEQCTGEKDETGKLVFENDVVLVFNPMTEQQNKCVVEWCKDASGYVCRYLDPENAQRGCAFASASGTYFEGIYCRVIGNIHEKVQNNNMEEK